MKEKAIKTKLTFLKTEVDTTDNCIFCKIVKGELPCHKIWETDTHLAFLSIFPNIKGFSVIIPKEHLSSNVQELDEVDYYELFKAGKTVAKLLSKKLDVERCAIIAEGMGINHAHLKLFPLIGTTPGEEWVAHNSTTETVFDHYEGYVSSHDGPRADDKELAKLAEKIRED